MPHLTTSLVIILTHGKRMINPNARFYATSSYIPKRPRNGGASISRSDRAQGSRNKPARATFGLLGSRI
jgi:hypothetical protein